MAKLKGARDAGARASATGIGRWARVPLSALAMLSLGACASNGDDDDLFFAEATTKIDYDAELTGAPSDAIDSLLRASLATFRRQEDGAQSLAFLRRRAQSDIETAETILRSYGYYEGTMEVAVDAPNEQRAEGDAAGEEAAGDEAAGDEASEDAATADAAPARARLTVRPGEQFTLVRHRLILIETGDTPPGDMDAAALGSPVGEGAVAAAITAAEQAAVAQLTENGRPYAVFRSRDAVADLEANTIEVDSVISTGPAYRFGELAFEGNPNIDDAYLESYRPWAPGDPYQDSLVQEYQRDLAETSLFRGVSVTPPDTPPEGETVPMAVAMEEAPFRTVGVGLRVSTDDGPEGRATFEHRNLFGANEQLTLTLRAGLDEQIAAANILTPQLLRDGQAFTTGLELRRIEEDRFDELGGTLTAGISRELTDRWTVGFGGLAEYSRIDDDGEESTAILAGLPLFAEFDGSNDDLNPTTGQRLRLDVTPFAGQFDEEFASFLVLQARGSAYQDLSGNGRFVLAERARIGSILSDDLDTVPPTRRFYSGGGGSVRGFQQDFIGPLDDSNDPVGGRSVAEAGIEFRGRIWGDIGGVVFVEGGTVSEEVIIDFSEDFLVAAGAGLRYYSPVGPIRVDVGFPLNGRDVDDSFQVYFSIGQAF